MWRAQLSNQDNKTPEILLSTSDFFKDTVKEAFIKLNIQTIPQSSLYLVQLLDHYAFADNLYNLDTKTGKRSMDTLAEMYLKAQQSELPQKKALLKRLGDTSLYISGFFGDSLKKKIVDLDYYIDLGGTAYASLDSTLTASDDSALLFSEF